MPVTVEVEIKGFPIDELARVMLDNPDGVFTSVVYSDGEEVDIYFRYKRPANNLEIEKYLNDNLNGVKYTLDLISKQINRNMMDKVSLSRWIDRKYQSSGVIAQNLLKLL